MSAKTHRDLHNIVLFSHAYLASLFRSSTHTHCHPNHAKPIVVFLKETRQLNIVNTNPEIFSSIRLLSEMLPCHFHRPPSSIPTQFSDPRRTISTDLFHGLAGLNCLSTQGRIPDFSRLANPWDTLPCEYEQFRKLVMILIFNFGVHLEERWTINEFKARLL